MKRSCWHSNGFYTHSWYVLAHNINYNLRWIPTIICGITKGVIFWWPYNCHAELPYHFHDVMMHQHNMLHIVTITTMTFQNGGQFDIFCIYLANEFGDPQILFHQTFSLSINHELGNFNKNLRCVIIFFNTRKQFLPNRENSTPKIFIKVLLS